MDRNKFLEAMKSADNTTRTENGAVTYKSTLNGLYDLFSMGAAYRTRSESDCIVLFKKAFEEDPVYAMKCLFYLRDVRGGQGERRFFRTVCYYLAQTKSTSDIMRHNLRYVPEFGRWDDLYAFVGTPLEGHAFEMIGDQLMLDLKCKTPSLLAKWLKSENASSKLTRALGTRTRIALGLTSRDYRRALSILRKKINIVERLMSENRWDEIEFDKIPSRAGLIYRNAFARHDIERQKANKPTYESFIKDDSTKVNAKALYPYEVVAKATKFTSINTYCRLVDEKKDIERAAINKYWDNLKDYFEGASLDALCMVDTSGSMWGTEASAPINVAISLGLYAAEKARGPFHNHYISFSSRPQLIEVQGVDFVDKVERIYRTNLCQNTNIRAAFDMLLRTAIANKCAQSDLPKTIVIISDMEFDHCQGWGDTPNASLMENIACDWCRAGYEMPNLVFWNVEARQNNIPMKAKNGVTLVSGFNPVLFEQIMKGKTGYDLMMDKLNEARYNCIGL